MMTSVLLAGVMPMGDRHRMGTSSASQPIARRRGFSGWVSSAVARVVDAHDDDDHQHYDPAVLFGQEHEDYGRQSASPGKGMCAAIEQGVGHVSAVELADGQHVQAGNEHSHPAGHEIRIELV